MPDPSHQAKRLVDAAVVNGPFTYAGWNRKVQDVGFNTTLEMVGAAPTDIPVLEREAQGYNMPTDTQTVDEWIDENDRYE